MASPVFSRSFTRERHTIPVPQMDAVTDSSGAPHPLILRLNRNIPSVQKRMVSQGVFFFVVVKLADHKEHEQQVSCCFCFASNGHNPRR